MEINNTLPDEQIKMINATILAEMESKDAQYDLYEPVNDYYIAWCNEESVNDDGMVKLCLTHPELNGERFWAEVMLQDEWGYIVRVDNQLISTDLHGIAYNDWMRIPNSVLGRGFVQAVPFSS